MCISQNNLYKQHHTMDFLQKPATYSKSLVHLSEVSICQRTYQCHQNEKSLCHCSQTSWAKCLVVYSFSITCCKLWQQFGWQLLYWNAEGCTSYLCHISISKVQIYTLLYVGYWLKKTALLDISVISAVIYCISHIILQIPFTVNNCNSLCIMGIFCDIRPHIQRLTVYFKMAVYYCICCNSLFGAILLRLFYFPNFLHLDWHDVPNYQWWE